MNLNNAWRFRQDWLSGQPPLYFPGIKDQVVFSYSCLELGLQGAGQFCGLFFALEATASSQLLESPGFFPSVIGKTDESVSLWSVPVGPLCRMKQNGQKQLRGICTMQYFQSFIIVLFLFFFIFKLFLSSAGLSVLNIVILLFLKKTRSPFYIKQFTIWTYIASEELQR